jgi:NAD(P)-dependent dehydrogenase (short-subunit alcohol dehydrogenase family)
VSGLMGKRVLIIGASGGIGRGVAVALAKAGARVAVAGRRQEALEGVCADLPTEGHAITCDVRKPEDCATVVEAAVRALGGLDAFVYSTGASVLSPLARTDAEQWHMILETNLIGASLICRAALPHLRQSYGRGVFLGSTSVARPFPGMCAYAASKAALEKMVEGWRTENPDVAFCMVRVGPTTGTEFTSGWDSDFAAETMARWLETGYRQPAAAMTVEDVSEAVCAVLSVPATVHSIDVTGTDINAEPAIQ